jgi:IPT/TIG domain
MLPSAAVLLQRWLRHFAYAICFNAAGVTIIRVMCRCVSPPASTAGPVSLALYCNGRLCSVTATAANTTAADAATAPAALTFTYTAALELGVASGDAPAGSVAEPVTADLFSAAGPLSLPLADSAALQHGAALLCTFTAPGGARLHSAGTAAVTAAAVAPDGTVTAAGSTRAVCQLPSDAPQLLRPGSGWQLAEVAVTDVSADVGDSSSSGSSSSGAAVSLTARVNFLALPAVTSLQPAQGPSSGSSSSSSAGPPLAVHGSGFVNTAALACRFSGAAGDHSGATAAVVAATFVSSTLVLCAAPARPPGSAVVEVTLTGADYSASGVLYTYTAAPVVTALAPALGSDTGGTAVTVTGAGFKQSAVAKQSGEGRQLLACRFGSVVVPAVRWVSSTEIVCIAPPRESPERSVALEVSVRSTRA